MPSVGDELEELRNEVKTTVNLGGNNVNTSPNPTNKIFTPSGSSGTIYSVFEHQVHGYKVVKNGFSWPAFFFGMIWAAVKKMWGLTLAFLSISILAGIVLSIIAVANNLSDDEANMIFIPFNIVYSIICGYFGNRWYNNYLISRGYKDCGKIDAKNVDDALSKIN